MKYDDFKTSITDVFYKYKELLSEELIHKFYKYMNLLIEWNEKINLTTIIEPKEIIEKHFLDSITVLPYIKQNDSIIDVGTGAGFPGIPIKIMKNDITVTLLDSLQKRVNFLNEVINQLKLANIESIHSRAEDYASKKREKYDVAVSRAVANMSTLSEYLLPFVKNGGCAIFMKGPNIQEELEESKKAIKLLGGKIEKIDNFALSNGNERNIIIISKIQETPARFPRKAGKPAKEPIK